MHSMNEKPKAIAVQLTNRAEKIVRNGHPWVFSASISKIGKAPRTGDLCVLFDRKTNKLFATGLFDENSPIRIKILNLGRTIIDKDFFVQRILAALETRTELINSRTNSFRLIYGENDLLPGMIVDIYAGVTVLKLYAAIWFPYLEALTNALAEILQPQAIVLRCSRNVLKEIKQQDLEGKVIFGELENEEVVFLENGIRFSANVVKGHKTGFFLDHRQNRIQVGKLCEDKSLLDVFAYAGGFSVHALVGGAREVTAVDISEQALEMAKKNAALNSYSGQFNTIAAEAFATLKNLISLQRKFEVVVIDPPSFAKSEKEIETALKKYAELATLGAQLTEKQGVLILASCSSRVSEEEFLNVHQDVFEGIVQEFDLIEVTTHDVDHPVLIPEAAYLKCAYYRRLK